MYVCMYVQAGADKKDRRGAIYQGRDHSRELRLRWRRNYARLTKKHKQIDGEADGWTDNQARRDKQTRRRGIFTTEGHDANRHGKTDREGGDTKNVGGRFDI